MDGNGKQILEATEENEQGWVDLTNQIGNTTFVPQIQQLLHGRQHSQAASDGLFHGRVSDVSRVCEAVFDGLNGFGSGLAFAVNLRRWNWATRN